MLSLLANIDDLVEQNKTLLAWISTPSESPNGSLAYLIHLTQEFGSKCDAKW